MSHTRIKFCGMTRAEDVRLAVELGVDFIGLILAERSPRRLLPGQARALRALVPEEIGVVALVMDNPRGEVADIVAGLHPDYLQFHGGEDDAFCAGFGLPFFKAIAMGDGGDPLEAMANFPSAHGFVLDGHGAGEQGGSGRSFDWTRLPKDSGRPVLLAGGLSPDNVALAIRTAHPWGVDVSSGIEATPGVKDAAKMRRFADAVRAADAAV
ncbi:phosphoribosylanthranilate isomerase [Pseudoxanthomonas helianthi]|uniref:N-(5'-phosphoribosyl)anthranilate isomerase n=1 Tax=Pseudoxanthomonas helianthi TaxID=1453541 RepID=A0A940X9N2_9GAMM|nr:phosphoribosylanthranilate isomerase [Pseudoxanthomonas helianthi]MBP3985789.1 phosphoribosylanthranilate isomerase [Pseudoxanthomonas helianthi]